MEPVKGFRPVAINVGVRNLEEAVAFYQATFGVKFELGDVDGRPVHARLQFGEGDSFFLFNLRERGADEPHRDHISAFGFVVDDLDATHQRAIAAGARQHLGPMDQEGLPRHSRFEDPSGNRIVLWQRSSETNPVEGISIPILPARHVPETLALFERLGFAVRLDDANEYAMVRRGTIELHFTGTPDLDPWTSAGMAFVRLDDVSALYEEFLAARVVPLVPAPRSELRRAERERAELRAKWDAGESIARMGEITDQPWGMREFPLLDPNNNLIRFGQVLRRGRLA